MPLRLTMLTSYTESFKDLGLLKKEYGGICGTAKFNIKLSYRYTNFWSEGFFFFFLPCAFDIVLEAKE